MNIWINGKEHRDIEKLTAGKLEHLVQLAQIEIDNYKRAIVNYSEQRMKAVGIPYLAELEGRRKKIELILEKNK
ncbi:hypothetical protein [Paraburkholderia sp. BCC1886]|uniref:hypothetical protein n=1 Tax=Paraburkholderia sp. BCC1886 TaxID=2562670 RepID=UPI0011824BAD|nr:hypothetical protein [Paraburkholderia sp. BCC1886]